MIQRLVLRLLFVPTLLVGLVGAGLLSAQSEPVHAIDPAGIETLRRQTDGQVRIGVHRATGAVRFLGLRPGSIAVQGNSPRERAADFFRSHGSLFGISNIDAQLSEPTLRTDPYGFTHLTYRQTHRNLPVFAGVIKVHADGLGRMTAVNGTFVPGIDIDTHPTWSARAAASVALAHVRGALELDRDVRIKPVADRLLVFRSGLVQQVDGTDHLAYEIEVEGTSVREFVYIDAHTGKVIDRYTGIHDAIERRIHEPDFDDVVIWDEGDTLPYSTGDSGNDDQVNDLIDFASDVYDLYSNLSGGTHLSWDGTDGTMHTVWNASFLGCPNASWNGTSTNYCDGVASDDVVAHEWTHAYTQATHGLIYRWQPGALNESYSDIFGEVVDFINGDGTDSPVSVRTAGDCSSFGGNPPPSLDINAPVSLAGGIPAAGAAFNPTPPVSVTADVELVNDGDDNNGNGSVTDGCEPLIGFTPGRIALIDRGTCSFVSKVNAAEAAGAVGVIVVNNQSGVFNMSGNDGGNVTPVLLIDIADGASIKVELGGGQTVNVTLALNSASASSYRWLVGEDSSGFGGSIRDMWNPVCFSDPGKISDVQYVCSSGDSGGVHSNSGVPNHLFALLVDGGTYNGQTITPIGLTKAAHLYWRAMSVYQVESSGFGDHADSLNQSCNDLLGIPLADLSTGAPSGLKINAGDCTQVLNGGLATEMQLEPDCDFQPLLTQSPPALTCPSIAFFDDFEGDPESVWTRTNAGVFAEYTPRDWALTADLSSGRNRQRLLRHRRYRSGKLHRRRR